MNTNNTDWLGDLCDEETCKNTVGKHTLIVLYAAFAGRDAATVYNGPYHTDDLETIFRDFNAVDGSAREMTRWLKIRSMSVGDRVCSDGMWWECKPSGWAMV